MTKTKPFLIAMSGGSGSGKSTLAEALLAHIPDGGAVMFGHAGHRLFHDPLAQFGGHGLVHALSSLARPAAQLDVTRRNTRRSGPAPWGVKR